MSNWIQLESQYYFPVAKRQPVVLVKGEGAWVWDEAGKRYLDFTSGWAVNALGHCHPVVIEALTNQGSTLIQTSNQFYTIPQLKLAQLLVSNSCFSRAFFCNSGAEANEGAVKLARKYGRLHLGGAYEVITALNSFHGRTLAMVAATGQPRFQETYEPLPQGFVNVPFNDIAAIKKATTPKTCAIMLEPVQGEGGVNVPCADYLGEVRAWCDEKGLLLILDEVQTGLGRLGELFGYQAFGMEPDIITLAKGLGGGVPIGAFLAKEKTSVFEPGDHGSTFGGNPLTCSVAYAVLSYVIENDILANVSQQGKRLMSGLNELKSRYDFLVDVRGMGLLLAVEFSANISSAVVANCNQEGLLLNPVKPNAVRLMPPLNLKESEVEEGLWLLEAGLKRIRL